MNNEISKNMRFERADGIRGLACLIVLITHAVTIFFTEATKYLAGTGKIGVWLFFVLSAFLLTHKFETTGFGIGAVARYLLGRFLRIMPLFTLAVIVYRIFGTAGIETWHEALDCLYFRQGFAHLWTIPVEFKFYFLLPIFAFVLKYFKRKWGSKGIFLSFILLLCLHQLFWPYWLMQINSIETIWYLPCFGLGILLTLTLRNSTIFFSSRVENLIYCFIILSLIFITPGPRHFLLSSPFDNSLSNKFILVGSIWTLYIACTISGNGWAAKIMQMKLMRTLGHCSYSIYLFHWLVYVKLEKCQINHFFAMPLAILLAILLGAAIYKFIECPMEEFRYTITNYLQHLIKINGVRYSRGS